MDHWMLTGGRAAGQLCGAERIHAPDAIDDRFTGDDSDYWSNKRIRDAVTTVKTIPKHIGR